MEEDVGRSHSSYFAPYALTQVPFYAGRRHVIWPLPLGDVAVQLSQADVGTRMWRRGEHLALLLTTEAANRKKWSCKCDTDTPETRCWRVNA